MIIQIDGIGTINKGAELMLYAILEEIEERFSDATVLLNSYKVSPKEIDTNLEVKKRYFLRLGDYPNTIFKKLGISARIFTTAYADAETDIVLDASGFKFGDQWNHSDRYLNQLENYYMGLKKNGAILVFLPQAFGPFNSSQGNRSITIINKYVDLLISRDEVSTNYLIDAGCNKKKVCQYSDFTNLVSGSMSSGYESLEGNVCIIPSSKMITNTKLESEAYINFNMQIIKNIKGLGHDVFLLNHEGSGDYNLCKRIRDCLNDEIHIVDGLGAKEIKGIIGNSYLVISSRFHGVANALSQGVPCFATSWSHKYKMLFQDYKLEDHILNITNGAETSFGKIKPFLEKRKNELIRNKIEMCSDDLKKETREMWKSVWSLI